MPSLPSKTSRQKHVTPIANLHESDVWQRTFKLLGLKPLTPFPDSEVTDMADTTAVEAPAADVDGAGPSTKPKLTILDLPSEMQKEIFKHASSTDLIALCLVSKHFRDIAASQLYRNFHIVFPDEDDPSYESPIDGLAGGLDTLVTSDYNYSRYLKEIILDTLSGGNKGERAYRHYTYDLSCGKFMNTLFLLALRKARALETFKWDLRVEISRPVFKALHNIPALEHLHIRMHAGVSLFEIPPPLPSLAQPSSQWQIISSVPSAPSLGGPPPPPFSSTSNSYSSAKFAAKPKIKINDVNVVKQPPTLSGFRNLKSLAILDMDTLEFVDEMRMCIKNSSSTLRKVKLSFSENLARQARKPAPVEDSNDESDQEMDEFGQMNPPPPPPPIASSSDEFTGPAKTFRAQEEKKSQEAVLGKIFSVGTSTTKKGEGDPETGSEVGEDKLEDKTAPGDRFLKDLINLGKKFTNAVNGSAPRTQQQKDVLELIEKAGRMYITEIEEKRAKAKKDVDETASEGGSTAKATPESSAASINGKADEDTNGDVKPKESETTSKTFDMFGEEIKKPRKSKEKDTSTDDSNPDDINIDEPEIVTDLMEFDEAPETREASSIHAQNGESSSAAEESLMTTSKSEILPNIDTKVEDESTFLDEPSTTIEPLDASSAMIVSLDKAKEDGSTTGEKSIVVEDREVVEAMNEYLRTSHGIPIETLSIYLIPIKASVLSKAIDFYALKHITLLNVGSQVPLWNLLTKQNKQSPLPLIKIHTDHVSLPFLTCVSQLESIKQLFLLERNSKVLEYSFASKTTVTMDQIRRLALKKHIGTLEQLMIKNENDSSWDASEQVVKLICKRGKNLEELAVSFGVRAVHIFNQYLPGLAKLRALHIISFRNDDTCHWVLREVRKFAVDSVSHNPDMKLEYIGMENSVERLVRRVKQSKPKIKGKAVDKGKGKEIEVVDLVFPTLEAILSPPADEESSDDESGSEDGLSPGLKLETLEGVRFYDVFGVRIFRKDVMAGRL